MRSKIQSLAFSVAILVPCIQTVAAQGFIVDAISNTVANAGKTPGDGCVPLNWDFAPKRWAKFEREAKPALDKYLALVAMGKNPGHAFKQRPTRHWAIDGQEVAKFANVIDPWASRIARVDQISLTLADNTIFGQGIWKAYDNSGAVLGTYDAKLVIASEGYRLVELNLWSPSNEGRAIPRFAQCPPKED